jgi:hypothetical protein
METICQSSGNKSIICEAVYQLSSVALNQHGNNMPVIWQLVNNL